MIGFVEEAFALFRRMQGHEFNPISSPLPAFWRLVPTWLFSRMSMERLSDMGISMMLLWGVPL